MVMIFDLKMTFIMQENVSSIFFICIRDY